MSRIRRPKKLLVIGMDGAFPKAVKKYMAEGVLPNIAKLVEKGVFCENCYCPTPTITPPNWTTIATGSNVGTHGLTCFHYHPEGTSLDTIIQNFDSGRVRSEYIWEAAGRVGKRSLVLSYISVWPPRGEGTINIAGRGGSEASWYYPGLPGWTYLFKYGLPQMFSSEIEPLATRVEFTEVDDGVYEVELPIVCRNSAHALEQMSWYLRLDDKGARLLDENKQHVCALEAGKWTTPITMRLGVGGQRQSARCMWKLLELDTEDEVLVLYRSALQSLSGNTYPGEIAREIDALPTIDHEPFELIFAESEHTDLYVECEHFHHEWLASVVDYCVKEKDVDIVFLHSHTMDTVNHPLRNCIEGTAEGSTPEKQKAAEEIERRCYVSYDQMIGKMVKTMGKGTMVVLVSDHGAIAYQAIFHTNEALKAAGLLATKGGQNGDEEVDWSKTKAFAQRSSYVYVNLKGRDPDGIVESSDLEKVKGQIVNVLMDYTGEKTGLKPVAYALKREEARWIGIFGADVGDVVYALRAPFGGTVGGVHGMQAPFAESEQGSMKPLLIMSGPGIKKGLTLERNVGLEDIVPTACYLLGIPVPKDVDGGIIYQALENPNIHLDEIKALGEVITKLERLIDYKRAQTHTY